MQSAPNLSIKTNQDRKQSLGATMSPTTPNDKERKASIVSVERANSIRSFESNQSKYNFRIPIWLVVFLQTFFIALLVVSIPLTISLRGTHESNLLSIAAGRNVSTTLGLIIQGDESANVANQLCIVLLI